MQKQDPCHMAIYVSPLGNICVTSNGEALTGLYFKDKIVGNAARQSEIPVISRTAEWLDIYFSGKEPSFSPPVHVEGTEFRLCIWELLLDIPYGKTVTYGELARQAAKISGRRRTAARAVGGAVGHNPISLIIPCHRVIGAGGKLTGYGGGLDRKRALLRLERVLI